jgi:hypothetical protein
MKTTAYFDLMRTRADRKDIQDEWIESALHRPLRREQQPDGRLRHWIAIPGIELRYLRVILLPDGETVHNAFLDRRFKP